MNCEEARQSLHEAAGVGMDAVRGHIESCAACREEARLHHETWRMLLALPAVAPSEGFLRGVKEKTHARTNRVLRFIAPLAAAAAAVILVVFALTGNTPPLDTVAAVQREVEKMAPEDRALFNALTADESAWELAENLDMMRAVDIVGADKMGQDHYLLGERK